MAILLVLGIFAALYMLWLIFSLATYALPFSVGLAISSGCTATAQACSQRPWSAS